MTPLRHPAQGFRPQYWAPFLRQPRNHMEAQVLYNHIRTLCWYLDQAPALDLPIGVGIDAVIGLVPWVGDFLGCIFSLYVIYLMSLYRPPYILLVRMLLRTFLDLLLGLIPLLGDFLDALYRANVLNLNDFEDWLMDGTSKTGGGRRWFVIIPPRDSWMDNSMKGRSSKTPTKVSSSFSSNGAGIPMNTSQRSWSSSVWQGGKTVMTYFGFAGKPNTRITELSSESSDSSDETTDRGPSYHVLQKNSHGQEFSTRSPHVNRPLGRARHRSAPGPMGIKDLKDEHVTVGEEADTFADRIKDERRRSGLGGKHEKDIRRQVREQK